MYGNSTKLFVKRTAILWENCMVNLRLYILNNVQLVTLWEFQFSLNGINYRTASLKLHNFKFVLLIMAMELVLS